MEKQRMYNIITQNFPVGFSILNKDGIIIDFNPAAEEITGYSRGEVIGKQHFEFLHGTSDRASCPLLKHALSQPEKGLRVPPPQRQTALVPEGAEARSDTGDAGGCGPPPEL